MTQVTNPSKKGDVIVLRQHHRDFMINPVETREYDSFDVAIVRGVGRDGRPGKLDRLAGQYDFLTRGRGGNSAHSATDYCVIQRSELRPDVSDDDLNAAVAGVAFTSYQDVAKVLGSFRPQVPA